MATLREVRLRDVGTMRLVEPSAKEARRLQNQNRVGVSDMYWRRLWPSSVALGRYIARKYGAVGVRGRRIIEIGCGLGFAGIVCAKLGGVVTFLDCVGSAVALAAGNARLNGVVERGSIVADWRREVVWRYGCEYDFLIGSDVLYDPEQWSGLKHILRRVVGQNRGVGLLADPRRMSRVDKERLREMVGSWSKLAERAEIIEWPPWGNPRRRRDMRVDIYTIEANGTTTATSR